MTTTDTTMMVERLRWALDALTSDEILTRRSLPALRADAERATQQRKVFDDSIRRRAAMPEQLPVLRSENAGVYAEFDDRIAAPAEAEARLAAVREQIRTTRRQLRELDPTQDALSALQQWGTRP